MISHVKFVLCINFACSWLAADKWPPAFWLFLYFYPLLSCGVGWGGIITSCLSAFHTYLPHGRHCLLGGVRRGGVGWDINVIFDCWKLTSALDATCSLVDLERFQPSLWRMASAGQASEWKPSGSHSRSLWGTGVLRPQAGVEIDMPTLARLNLTWSWCFGTCGCEAMVVQNVV